MFRTQTIVDDMAKTPTAKRTLKATATAHAAILGSLLKSEDLIILGPLNAEDSPQILPTFFRNLKIAGEALDPRKTPSKSSVKKAHTFLKKHYASMCLSFSEALHVLFVRLAKSGVFIATKVLEIASRLLESKLSWPSDLVRSFRDISGASFVIDDELLSAYEGNIMNLVQSVHVVALAHEKFAKVLPRIISKLSRQNRLEYFFPALDRMSESSVFEDPLDRPLCLAPQVRKVTAKTDLGKLFWKSLAALATDRKNSKRKPSWGLLILNYLPHLNVLIPELPAAQAGEEDEAIYSSEEVRGLGCKILLTHLTRGPPPRRRRLHRRMRFNTSPRPRAVTPIQATPKALYV